ncbi:unnamed protein product [Spodoptera exigua]|nr:unnamed protein product [Spodoptera exigua]
MSGEVLPSFLCVEVERTAAMPAVAVAVAAAVCVESSATTVQQPAQPAQWAHKPDLY